jgi:hypothetical protein
MLCNAGTEWSAVAAIAHNLEARPSIGKLQNLKIRAGFESLRQRYRTTRKLRQQPWESNVTREWLLCNTETARSYKSSDLRGNAS